MLIKANGPKSNFKYRHRSGFVHLQINCCLEGFHVVQFQLHGLHHAKCLN